MQQNNVFCWGNSEYQQLSMVTSEQQVCVPTHLPLKDVGKVQVLKQKQFEFIKQMVPRV